MGTASTRWSRWGLSSWLSQHSCITTPINPPSPPAIGPVPVGPVPVGPVPAVGPVSAISTTLSPFGKVSGVLLVLAG